MLALLYLCSQILLMMSYDSLIYIILSLMLSEAQLELLSEA